MFVINSSLAAFDLVSARERLRMLLRPEPRNEHDRAEHWQNIIHISQEASVRGQKVGC